MPEFSSHTPEFWNDRYRADEYIYGQSPNAYLASQLPRLRTLLRPGAKALVPGDGEGRNGVFLAEQGFDVTAIDLSDAGLQKAQALASQQGVSITTIQADLTAWPWPVAEFDVVASIFLHLPSDIRQTLHRNMLRSLRPGGLLIIEAFRPEQLDYRQKYNSRGGPPQVDMLFSAATLREDFQGADVLELEETELEIREGTHHGGLSAVTHGLFQSPTSPSR